MTFGSQIQARFLRMCEGCSTKGYDIVFFITVSLTKVDNETLVLSDRFSVFLYQRMCSYFRFQNLAKVKACHTQVIEEMEKLNEELKQVSQVRAKALFTVQ